MSWIVRLTEDLVVKDNRGRSVVLLRKGTAAVGEMGKVIFSWREFSGVEYEFVKCPACDLTLSLGQKQVYETVVEHIEDPNQDLKKKHTVICVNKHCRLFGKGFWGKFGSFYSYNFGEFRGEDLSIEPLFLDLSLPDLRL